MKRKLFFKVFVVAVLAAFVTLSSCKNYDDDIDGLNAKIEKLASKEDLTSQLTTLQTAITAAQTAANSATTKADQALAAAKAIGDVKAIAKAEADVAAAKVKTETLAELTTQMTKLKAEIQASNDKMLEGLNKSMAELEAKVKEATGLLAGVVYDVELIPSFTSGGTANLANAIFFSSATQQANVFQTGIANAITFVKDAQVQTGTSFVIRVSPTNVIVTPEMISLQNSMGATYDNVKVTKVVAEETLITRAANGGGLWRVHVELKNYNADAFKTATIKDTKKVLFAVAVNNGGSKEVRNVISSYDLALDYSPYTPAGQLFFFVGDKHVKDVNNRYTNSSISLGNPDSGTVYAEKTWKSTPATAPTADNTNVDGSDNRSSVAVYPAVQGQAIKIALTQAPDDTKATAPSNIRGLYVTLDKEDNAIDSAPSEWNAWKGYSYTGLNTVVEGTQTEIIINSTNAIKDMIGFRVYAVNFDGTLVDPDGKAFYVSLGKEATNWNAVNTTVTATEEGKIVTDVKSALSNATLTKLTGAATYEWTTDKADNSATTTPAFNVYFVKADGTTAVFNTSGAAGNVDSSIDFSTATKVYTMATVSDWLAYKDNKVYNGKLTIKDALGHVLATLNVSFKKVLPTAPEGFSVKSEQLTNGVYYSYLNPDNWSAPNASAGTMPLGQVFNFGLGTLSKYETTFAASAVGTPLVAVTVIGDGTLSVAKSFVDNTTQHATKVVYNFGKISTETKTGTTINDYKVTIQEFPTVYSNIYNSTYSWNWATKTQLNLAADATLPYNTFVTYGDNPTIIDLAHIFGVSTRDSKYNAFLSSPYLNSLVVESAKLVSNANNLDEYFKVTPDPLTGTTFTLNQQSTATNPSADVASTLILNAKDMYGNPVTIKLPFTVKKR